MVWYLALSVVLIALLGILMYLFRRGKVSKGSSFLLVLLVLLMASFVYFSFNLKTSPSPVGQKFASEDEAISAMETWILQTAQDGEWTIDQTEDGSWMILVVE